MESKKHQNNQVSQLDKAKAVLCGLKADISAEDREAAANELKLGSATVKRYLIGEVKKLDVALRLIRFFRGRIEKRERELAA
jgi:hypothetical protein